LKHSGVFVGRRKDRGEQGSLFGEIGRRSRTRGPVASKVEKTASGGAEKWRMPAPTGSTVASLRLLWMKRLTPAQVAEVEAEIAALPRMLSNLGFGPVLLEKSSVRRKRD
jgi:hypothetical protein